MARKTKTVTIEQEGRDKGKVFILTEMPASQAEAWAARALIALLAENPSMASKYKEAGMAGMAELGMKMFGNLKWEVVQPLLKEMMECAKIIPNPEKPIITRRLFEEDIEEVATLLFLRMEIWELHTGFSLAATPSI
jgi:hypothetical protein